MKYVAIISRALQIMQVAFKFRGSHGARQIRPQAKRKLKHLHDRAESGASRLLKNIIFNFEIINTNSDISVCNYSQYNSHSVAFCKSIHILETAFNLRDY